MADMCPAALSWPVCGWPKRIGWAGELGVWLLRIVEGVPKAERLTRLTWKSAKYDMVYALYPHYRYTE